MKIAFAAFITLFLLVFVSVSVRGEGERLEIALAFGLVAGIVGAGLALLWEWALS